MYDFDEISFDEEEGIEGIKGPLATHCNVPLKFTAARAALGRPTPGQKISRFNRYKRELELIQKVAGKCHIHFLDQTRHQYRALNCLTIPMKEKVMKEWNQQIQIAEKLWDLNIKTLKEVDKSLNVNPRINISNETKLVIRTSYLLKCFYEEGVLSSGSKFHKPTLWWRKNQDGVTYVDLMDCGLYLTDNLFLIRSADGTALLSRDHFLIWSDLAAQRYSIRLLRLMEEENGIGMNLSLKELNRFLEIGDSILYKGGNLSYKLIYGLEPEAVSHLVGDIPVGRADGDSFKKTVITELQTLARKFKVEDLYEERRVFLERKKESPDVLSQLHGLYRIWGHPTVEPLDGASALKKIATQTRMLHQAKSEAIERKFKEEFIIRYIAKYNKWPKLNCESLSPNNPIRVAYDQQSVFPLLSPNYKRSHLSLVNFGATFPVDPKFDLTEMLADKALSLPTDLLINKLSMGQGVGSSIERSVLVSWLESSLHDPKQFLEKVDRDGFPNNECSNGLKEKEREGKVDARMFGLMTLNKRMYIVLTEALLAEHILPLFPEITMTDDELKLDKKRRQFTSKVSDQVRFFTSLDFSKWNSNMREEETIGLFTDFDHLFGFSQVFSRTHEMFKTSFMYLLNGSYTPTLRSSVKFIPDLGGWYNHLGGIEGLRQKGWTVWTITLILLASENLPVKIGLMGQGDNQILKELYEKSMTYDRALAIHFSFINALNDLLTHVGPPLKMEETWTSTDLYVYGKYMIWKGAPLPTYYKRICRMFRLSNEDYPTLESTLSSLTANFSSALACSWDPGVLYVMYVMEAIGSIQMFIHSSYLQSTLPLFTIDRPSSISIPHTQGVSKIAVPRLISSNRVIDNDFYQFLLMIPRVFGGFPITNLPQALLRGFPDEVSLSISILKKFWTHGNMKEKIAISRILTPTLSNTTSYEMLFEHPTALNLQVPPTPSESRRNLVIDFLKTSPRIRNQAFSQFLTLLDDPRERDLLRYLEGAEPFNPRFLGQIAGATLGARARHLAGRLQKTKTISELARVEGKKDIHTKVAFTELNHFISVIRRVKIDSIGSIQWFSAKCSVQHAIDLRKAGWGKDIVGVDCVPPYEFMEIEPVSELTHCPNDCDLEKGYIAITQTTNLTEEESSNALIVGSHPAYRGSATNRKTSGYGDRLSEVADPLLTKLLALFSLIGWATPREGHLASLIVAMLRSRTDVNPDILLSDEDQLVGSVHHRLQDERTGHGGAVAILPNFGTRFFFNTFPLSAYSKGSKNVNLMFQSILSLATCTRSWGLRQGSSAKTPTFHIHVKRACCVREINEDAIDCKASPSFQIPSYPNNPYLYVKKEGMAEVLTFSTLFPKTMISTRDPNESTSRLVSLLALEIVSMLRVGLWHHPSERFAHMGLLINWALRCPLQSLLEHITFLIGVYFFPALRNSSPQDYLTRLSEAIIKSPLPEWTQLSNLLFCPNFHHELVAAPYYVTISGNPQLSPYILASNLRIAVSQIASTWASDSETRNRIDSCYVISGPGCGLNFHPALQLLYQDFVMSRVVGDVQDIRLKITGLINSPLDTPLPSLNLKCAQRYYRVGSKRITGDTLDTLCKFAAEIADLTQNIKDIGHLLPPSVDIIYSVRRSQLSFSEARLQSVSPSENNQYRSHRLRPFANPTSGPYKGLGLLRHIHPYVPKSAAVCGDGAGGFTWATLRTFSNCVVMYNSLIESSDSIQQAAPVPYLPALAGWPGFEPRLRGLDLVNEGISNISDPRFIHSLRRYNISSSDLIIGDMESPNYLEGVEPIHMTLHMARIARALQSQILIKKDYALNVRSLRVSVSILLAFFKEVEVLRSHFSSETNTEVYLLARGPIVGICPEILGELVTGNLLPVEFELFFESVFLPSVGGHSSVTQQVLWDYTLAIEPRATSALIGQLLQGIPFIMKRSPIIFPHSVTEWVGLTSTKTTKKPNFGKKNMESISLPKRILARWLLAYLSLWTALSEENHVSLDTRWSSLHLVWFRTLNNSWGFSVTDKQGCPQDSRHIKCWHISTILISRDLKIIHRLAGIITMLGMNLVDLSGGIEVGGRDAHGRALTASYLAVDEWCRTTIQGVNRPQETLRFTPRQLESATSLRNLARRSRKSRQT